MIFGGQHSKLTQVYRGFRVKGKCDLHDHSMLPLLLLIVSGYFKYLSEIIK